MAYDLEVLLPFHKDDFFLTQAISSLSRSKAINFNVILIDDRIDKTRNLNRLFHQLPNFQVVKTEGFTGYGNALKLGSRAITSSAVALFNSDDEIHPLRFYKQLQMLDRYPMNFTKMQRITTQGKAHKSISGDLLGGQYDPIFLMLGSYGANATWCMRAEWWAENAFFDADESLDWRIALSSFTKTSVGYIDENLYFYRKHLGQKTANKSLSQKSLNPVYSKWNDLSKKLSLGDFSFDTFMLLGVPWNKVDEIGFSDFFKAGININAYAEKLDHSVQKDIFRLLRRRYIFALRNKSNLSIKSKLILKGLLEIPSLAQDFLR
jgi:Glycosyl transferase family 2